jgi:two-component system nitrate/nitrite response regulator NarL
MRLVICDDNRILCEALGVALEARGHLVLATTTTTVLGIAAVAEHQPDACLLDLRFPEPPDGLDAARVIRHRHPGTAVLLLSGLIDPAVRSEAMRIGVAGSLRKDQNVDHVAEALDVIASGGVIFDSMMTVRPDLRERRRAFPAYVLTPREQDVLRRMVAGQNTTQMSREMNIEVSTLRTYVKNVLAKLGVHSRLQAAALATREHLLDDWTARPSA